jgi:hypothetical protein
VIAVEPLGLLPWAVIVRRSRSPGVCLRVTKRRLYRIVLDTTGERQWMLDEVAFFKWTPRTEVELSDARGETPRVVVQGFNVRAVAPQ